MAEDLGEVRVKIQEEGAQEAADTIGDAVGEGMADGGGGGEAGGGGGGMLGGISTKLAAILGFVAFLASLKPIQEILGGLQRLFSVAILPLVALLTTFLRPILQKLLRFIGNFDFDNVGQELLNLFSGLLSDLGQVIQNSITSALSFIPGVGAEDDGGFESPDSGESIADANPDRYREGPFGLDVRKGSPAEDIFINLDMLGEQANTSLEANSAGSNSEVTQNNTTGTQN